MIFTSNTDKIIPAREFSLKGDVYTHKVDGIFFYMHLYITKGTETDSKKTLSI